MSSITPYSFTNLCLDDKVKMLYQEGTFIVSIRYYQYKVNLYLLEDFYVEVFCNHKQGLIEKIEPLENSNSRLKFYLDQIQLPADLLS